MYITVIDDYEIVERAQHRGVDGTFYKDWDITFEKLPPTLSGLQSVYADLTAGATAIYSFAPIAVAQASGATISSWLWDVGDGSITVGTSSTQNITVSFPGYVTNEHRWVELKVTDSNGNYTIFHFEVYTVDPTSSSASILNINKVDVSGTVEDGFNAVVSPWAGFSKTDVLDETRCTIVSVDNYGGTSTPIVSNIIMIGRLRTEDNATSGSDTHGTLQTSTLNIEGFGTRLARLPAPALYIIDDATPTVWGRIKDLDPTRAMVYFLAFPYNLLRAVQRCI